MAMALINRVDLLNSGDMTPEDVKSEWILLGLYYLLSYAYYVRDDPLVSDSIYDALCKVCYKRSKSEMCIPELREHRYDFKAGTGFGLKYPEFTSPPAEYTYFLRKSLQFMGEFVKKRSVSSDKPTKNKAKKGQTYSETSSKKQGRLFK